MVVYRSMVPDHSGRPECGAGAGQLGARPIDIKAKDGTVHPVTGGMSVNESILKIPKHLKGEKHGGEAGDLPMFEFALTHLTEGLTYRVTKGTHGQLEPAMSMLLANYQALLCGTKPNWKEV